jgi:hypothetical protein
LLISLIANEEEAMQSPNKQSPWSQWKRPERIIPVLTILAAGIAILLSTLEIIDLSIADEIVIGLLALLAVDALTERLSLLDSIKDELRRIAGPPSLQSKQDIPKVEHQARRASEISVIAISAAGLTVKHLSFFEERIAHGCTLRMILVDPRSPFLEALNRQDRQPTSETDIEATLRNFSYLVQDTTRAGSCQIRLLDVFLPFSMFAVDLDNNDGSMVVEFHVYKGTSRERPHVLMTPDSSPQWYHFFKKQFEEAWNNAIEWDG